jgi:hypothetical protein
MCEQRGPTEDDFKKWRSHPKGYSPAANYNQAFSSVLRFSKVTRTARDWHRKQAWMPSHTRLSAANEPPA